MRRKADMAESEKELSRLRRGLAKAEDKRRALRLAMDEPLPPLEFHKLWKNLNDCCFKIAKLRLRMRAPWEG